MDPLVAAHLFLTGLAAGLALLCATSYRSVTPAWLRWLLIGVTLFTASRYGAMALFNLPQATERLWFLRYCWYASTIGLSLPSVFAIDQLLQHPAITPKKILRNYLPFLLVFLAVILFGTGPTPEVPEAWNVELSGGWRRLLFVTQGAFTIAFLVVCGLLIRKPLPPPIRFAVLGLLLAHLALGLDVLIVSLGGWYFHPFLFSEMLALAAIWNAFETAASLRTNR